MKTGYVILLITCCDCCRSLAGTAGQAQTICIPRPERRQRFD